MFEFLLADTELNVNQKVTQFKLAGFEKHFNTSNTLINEI